MSAALICARVSFAARAGSGAPASSVMMLALHESVQLPPGQVYVPRLPW